MGHVHQPSAEPLRTTPVVLPIEAESGALTTWVPIFIIPPIASSVGWLNLQTKQYFPVGTVLAPGELEASGLRVQS